MKAPCSFERFVRKLFLNEPGLPTNSEYIEKVNKSSHIIAYPMAHFTCTTAQAFSEIYEEDIAGTEGYCILINKIPPHAEKIFPTHSESWSDISFLHIYSNWRNDQSREYYVNMSLLRQLALQYMPKKKKDIKDETNCVQEEISNSRFDIMDWGD